MLIGLKLTGHQLLEARSRRIPTRVRAEIEAKPCTHCGRRTAAIQIDHRDGRYSRESIDSRGFQALCAACNAQKREACKKCAATNMRFDATSFGFEIPWISGGEEHPCGEERPCIGGAPGSEIEDLGGCEGCYWADPYKFRAGIFEYLEDANIDKSAMNPPKSIQYIGSKAKLLRHIIAIADSLRGETPRHETQIVDLFCGSAVVTATALAEGFEVASFDTEEYAVTLAAGFATPFTPELSALVIEMQAAAAGAGEDAAGFIAREYSANRQYWTASNARGIDAARRFIDEHGVAGSRAFLMASLLVAADAVSNGASVYGAYLKSFKPAAQRAMAIRPLHQNATPAPGGSTVLRGSDHCEALNLAGGRPANVKIVYADPPYNGRQYSANYHPLRAIVTYNPDLVRLGTKTGLMCNPYISPFCRKREAAGAFRELRGAAAGAGADYLVVSYSNEGVVPFEELLEILGGGAPPAVETIPHPRYNSGGGGAHKTVNEYIITVRLKAAPAPLNVAPAPLKAAPAELAVTDEELDALLSDLAL